MDGRSLTITALEGIPLVRPGDGIAAILTGALERAEYIPADRDIVVVAQKIVSKAEGRHLNLEQVSPSDEAVKLGAATGKPAAHVQAIMDESDEIVRHREGVIIAAHRLGLVLANAGIDRSNVEQDEEGERVLRLPLDPDRSAAGIKAKLDARFDADIGVIIADSVGRAWRLGTVGLAIGAAGVPSLIDLRGQPDLHGRPLEVSMTGFADAVSAAALVRPPQEDLFR